MSGTKEGAAKTTQKLKEKYGEDYYKNIGAKGGRALTGMKGFALNPELAKRAGAKGGKISKRRKSN